MQTSPVLNQANALSNAVPTNKAPEADTSATPFNQMLSREIADRREADEASNTPSSNGTPSTRQADDSTKTKDTKDAKTVDDDKSGNDDKQRADASATAVTQTPADMLALVANLNQVRPDAKNTAATAAAQIAAGPLPTASAKKPLPAADVPATDLAPSTAAGKDAKKTVATLPDTKDEHAADPKADPTAAKTIGATLAKPTAELAAKSEHALATGAAKPDFSAELKASMTAPAATPQPIQQLAQPLPQAAGAPSTDKLTPPVGTPDWNQSLGQKVVWMVAGGQQSASLTLNPPDLGPLQVVLNVHNATADATFTAAQPEVRHALEAAMPKLRDMLGDAGIQLGQATVNSGAPNPQQTPDRHPSPGMRQAERSDGTVDTTIRAVRVQPTAIGNGLVDTFV